MNQMQEQADDWPVGGSVQATGGATGVHEAYLREHRCPSSSIDEWCMHMEHCVMEIGVGV